MKTLLVLLLSVTLLHAGTEVVLPTPTPSLVGSIFSELQSAIVAKQLEVSVAPMYAPKIANHWGAELQLLHPLGDFGFVGVQMNFLNGNYVAGEASVGLKASFPVYGFKVTPYAKVGTGVPIGGAGDKDHQFSAIAGTGAEVVLFETKDKKEQIGLYGGIEYWSDYPGVQIYVLGAQAKFNF